MPEVDRLYGQKSYIVRCTSSVRHWWQPCFRAGFIVEEHPYPKYIGETFTLGSWELLVHNAYIHRHPYTPPIITDMLNRRANPPALKVIK